MKLLFNIALGIHIVAIIGLLLSLLIQLTKPEKRLLPGALHSAWTALGAGVVMLAVNPMIKGADPLNHVKFTVKGAILAVILYLGITASKSGKLTTRAWAAMLILTLTNVAIASSWK